MRYLWILVLVGLGACGASQLVDVEGTGAAYNKSPYDEVDILVNAKYFGTLAPGASASFHFAVPVKGAFGIVDPGTSQTAGVSVSFFNRRTKVPTQPVPCSGGTATVTQMVYHPATSQYSSDWAECWSSQSYNLIPKKDSLLFASGAKR